MSEANPQPQQVLIYPQYPNQNDSEISLFDIWQVLVKQKKTIFSVASIVTIAAILYALSLTPSYKTTAVFLPPDSNDIQALNIKNVSGVNISTVYAVFRENLGSIALRRTLFEQMKLVDQLVAERDETTNVNEIFNQFNTKINLIIPDVKENEYILPTTTLSLEERDPVLIAEIINHLAEAAEQATIIQLISDIKAKVNGHIEEIKIEIELLRDKTKKQRRDEIERLEIADLLERSKIEDKIKTLRDSAKAKRLDEIERLESLDLLERSQIKDKIKTLPITQKSFLFPKNSFKTFISP